MQHGQNNDGDEVKNGEETVGSWLRQDCLEFYRKELLLPDGSSSTTANKSRLKHSRKSPPIQVKERLGLLRLGIDKSMVVKQRFPNAQFLEFGVHEGKDMVRMATFLRSVEEKKRPKSGSSKTQPLSHTTFHGFDSFEGLPEDWINGQTGEDDKPFHKKGAFDTGGDPPDVDSVRRDLRLSTEEPLSVQFHKGWFDETLPQFLNGKDEHGDQHVDEPVAFVHADADLYTSTKTVLDLLCEKKLFRKGSIVIFDEFWNYPNWQNGEYKAWLETVENFGLEYEYFAYHAPHPTRQRKEYGYQSVGVMITRDMGR
uniref:Uncharacterized protein n=1 Tax=Pseudo-nitzschia australis TaxID=44445 RepID=A0A7S4AVG9_9STRA|mmetsp:Transcript_20770/g.45216  ORF Transcript_20770/g.45216 Transcript_20770/m.45216 type:complete len:312 (-) Transcript_20770:265-1200(-)